MKVIGVNLNFNNLNRTQQPYAFNCYSEVKKGDYVVVDTVNGFTLGVVVEEDMCSDKATKDVVDVVDMSDFYARKAKRERMAELKNKMDAKVKELQNIAIYEALAKNDPALASMLEEFKSII